MASIALRWCRWLATAAAASAASGPGAAAAEPEQQQDACMSVAVCAALVALAEPQAKEQADSGPVILLAPAPPSPSRGQLNFVFRTFADTQVVENVLERHAWTQNMQANYESGFTPGWAGFGLDISPFASVVINASKNAGNMINVADDGMSRDSRARIYLGKYAVKARLGGMVLKYGLQQFSNPFLESKDNRSLPSTFKGFSLLGKAGQDVSLDAGSVTAGMPRGHKSLSGLTTTYGATRFDRFDFMGANWAYRNNANLAVYAGRARDVWTQTYLSLRDSVGDARSLQWSSNLNYYRTREHGLRLQGRIDNKAYSLNLSATHRTYTASAIFQRIVGDQYFDYVGETWGIYLENAMNVDYNAPHERSLQLRFTIDDAALGRGGAKLMLWAMSGWAADGGAESKRHAEPGDPMSILYWKGGQIMRGSHREIGVNPSYTVQSGRFKDTRLSLIATVHRSAPTYIDDPNREIRVMIDMPMKGF